MDPPPSLPVFSTTDLPTCNLLRSTEEETGLKSTSKKRNMDETPVEMISYETCGPYEDYGTYDPDAEVPVDYTLNKTVHGGKKSFWYFILCLLTDPTKKEVISWTGRGFEFVIKSPDDLTKLWTQEQQKDEECEWRYIRRNFYGRYKKRIFVPVDARKLVFAYITELYVHLSGWTKEILATYISNHHTAIKLKLWTKKQRENIDEQEDYCTYDPKAVSVNRTLVKRRYDDRKLFWYFILCLLTDPTKKNVISWTGHGYEFVIQSPNDLTKLWTHEQQKNEDCEWSNILRNFRDGYKKRIFSPVDTSKLIYAFITEPSVHLTGWTKERLVSYISLHQTLVAPMLWQAKKQQIEIERVIPTDDKIEQLNVKPSLSSPSTANPFEGLFAPVPMQFQSPSPSTPTPSPSPVSLLPFSIDRILGIV